MLHLDKGPVGNTTVPRNGVEIEVAVIIVRRPLHLIKIQPKIVNTFRNLPNQLLVLPIHC